MAGATTITERSSGVRGSSAAIEQPVVFAPVRVTTRQAATTTQGSGLDVMIGGAIVRVSHGFDGALLRRVVEASSHLDA